MVPYAMLAKLKSRKLWASVLGSALVAFGTELGLDPEQTTQIVAVVVGYLLSQGAVDAMAARKS